MFFLLLNTMGQGRKEMTLKAAVENWRKAVIGTDSTVLDKLLDDNLSYGHSGGTVEGKKEFMAKILSGKSVFVTMELSDQTISFSKDVAIVRHKLHAITKDNGKPGEVHLLVLMVWQHLQGKWSLLARQAVKAP